MGINNGRKRTAKVRTTDERCQLESEPRSLGAIPSFSGKTGAYEVGASREDCNERDNSIGGNYPDSGISGKALNHLVEETKKQLAYHEHQAEILRNRLDELQAIDISHTQ